MDIHYAKLHVKFEVCHTLITEHYSRYVIGKEELSFMRFLE